MISVIRLVGLALIIGSVFAGDGHNPHHHHHHRGHVQILTTGPAKSSPLLLAKGVPAYYAHHDHHHGGHPYALAGHHGGHLFALDGHHGGHLHALGGHHHGGHLHALSGHHGGHLHALAHGSHGHAHGHSGAYAVPTGYTYNAPSADQVALLSTAGKPKTYAKSIPSAAVRNVETVMVTKTITPVVTKTTTHHRHAEPALSIGHVQGYSQQAIGHPKLAPIQFNTAYTTYANPTVGVNGPILYSGPAVGYTKALAAGPAVAEVVKSVELPQAYKTAAISASPYGGAYAVYPGSALQLSPYGLDAHSYPVSNFLDLRSGKAVFAAHGHGHHEHVHQAPPAHGHHAHLHQAPVHAHIQQAISHGDVHQGPSHGHRAHGHRHVSSHQEHEYLHKK